MAKQLRFSEEARAAMKIGADKLANAVKATLGPKGRYVLLGQKGGTPIVTNDGVTIAKEIILPDHFENLGATLVREASVKTNDVVGDGTTTACVLAQAILSEGMRCLASGASAPHIRRGFEKAVHAVNVELLKMRIPVELDEQKRDALVQVATISANDRIIGEFIVDAILKVGRSGVITVEEGRSAETSLVVVEGMQFDRGYVAPHFATDQARMECVLDDAVILITDKKISMLDSFFPLLERIAKMGKPFLIVADEIDGAVLTTLVVNKVKGKLKCVAVKAPGYGDNRKELLKDIAILTGGHVVTSDTGLDFLNADVGVLGRAAKIIVDRNSTTIVDGAGKPEDIKAHVKNLRGQIEAVSDYDSEKLKERIAKLSGGIAVIEVGAPTESEMKAKKYKVEDAVNATRAGVEEGIVAGGGVALLRCAEAIRDLRGENQDEQAGIDIVRRAMQEPVRTIAENAGLNGAVIVNHILSQENPTFGFNAETGEFGNMTESGIIDPVKVTRSALENAVSIAGLILTTEVLVSRDLSDEPVYGI